MAPNVPTLELILNPLNCAICESDNTKKIFPLIGGTSLVQCNSCNLYYKNGYHSSLRREEEKPSFSEDYKNSREKLFQDYLNHLKDGAKILDVGCSYGFFLNLCKERGFETMGVEPNKPQGDYGRKKLKLDIRTGVIEDCALPNSYFTNATFWNVLEWIPNPKKALEVTKNSLQTGGELTIRALNSSFHVPMYNFFRKYSSEQRKVNPAMLALYMFNKSTITRLLELTGYTDIKIKPAISVWTEKHGDMDTPKKRLISFLMNGFSKGIYTLSGKRKVISPNLIITAKTSN